MQETVYLSDTRSPLRIEYSQAAMEQIRKRARDGLMAAPRIGMGVGGLLVGVSEKGRIRLLDSVDIPCSHSAGPSFNLTRDEKRESREMVAEAGALSVSGKVGVVGWYCSKTRGDAVLNESDLSFYAELFPGRGQIALVLRPSLFESMRAAFFFRDEHGAVVKGLECEVDEWRPLANTGLAAVEPEPEVEVAEARPPEESLKPVELPKPVEPTKPAESPKVVEIRTPVASVVETPVETRLADIIDLTGEAPGRPAAPPVRRKELFGVPEFAVSPPPQRSKIRLVLAAAAVLLAAGAAAYFTQDSWLPKPPLTLTSTESNGSLLIHWNPEALRGIDHAQMFVNDGGQPTPSVIPLDRLQMNSGLLSYTPKSKRVTAKLDAGDITGITAWFAPEPAPAADPASSTAPAAAPGSTGDAPPSTVQTPAPPQK
jgi:hypothetical protein